MESDSIIAELLIIALLILFNGLFSLAEIAIVSSRKTRLESMAKKGNAGAKTALELMQEPTRFLSIVQIGITLIGVLTGAFGGTLDYQVKTQIQKIELLAPYADKLSFFIIIVFLTYFSLVLGELVPKRIGLNNPEGVAAWASRPMYILSRIAAPVVSFLTFSTEIFLKLFRLKVNEEAGITEEEVRSLIAQGTVMGTFEEVEQDMVERVFHLGDRKVASLMTSSIDIEWLDVNDTVDKNKNIIVNTGFNAYLLCEDTIDNVLGVVYAKDFLIVLTNNQEMDLKSLATPALFVPENMSAFHVLDRFKAQNLRLAVVIDEYGAVNGMVTSTDLFEALTGNLDQPTGHDDAQIIQREDGSYLVDALLPFEDFLQYFDVEAVEAEEKAGFHTLGGFILHLNKQIPHTGDCFTWRNFILEIIDMDANRIDKILVKVLNI